MKYKIKKTISITIISIIIVVCSLKFGVFFDNVIFVSEMGFHLFENGLLNWNSFPLESDPGHPPFIATFMALGWWLFGKSLAVSHWMMLPCIFGLLWQIESFVSFFVKDKKLRIWACLLVIIDPTLLSHLVLINVEVIQLFFFFLALNAVLRNRNYQKIIGLIFLGITSYRGMMLCAGIFLIDLFIFILVEKKSIKKFIGYKIFLTYTIAAFPAILYLVWRILFKGWIMSHPLQIWGNAWAYSSLEEFLANFLRNILVLIQRFTDFGRIALLMFVFFTLYIKRKSINWVQIKPLILVFVFSTVLIYSFSLIIVSPIGHNYFIPSYLALGLLSFILINEYKKKWIIYVGLISSLLLGNFIVYPDKFAQGWESSLAHLPYWNLRQNAIEYMDSNSIPISKTASFFPNTLSIDHIDLNYDLRKFCKFSGTEEYAFYSNVYNLSDSELEELHQNYFILKTFSKFNVRIEIMQKKNN